MRLAYQAACDVRRPREPREISAGEEPSAERVLDIRSVLGKLSIMSTEPNRLGSFLAVLRRSKGLSLRAVEAETGISNAYLSQLETGKIREPSRRTSTS